MELARIDGYVTSTVCHPTLRGWALRLCQPIDEQGRELGVPVVAIDPCGAGLHQRVVLSSDGAGARSIVQDDTTPLRYLVVGIVDEAVTS